LEQLFADLGTPSGAAAPIAGAVDIRSLPTPAKEPVKVAQVVLPKPAAKAPAKKPEEEAASPSELTEACAPATPARRGRQTAASRKAAADRAKACAKLAGPAKPAGTKAAIEAKEAADAKEALCAPDAKTPRGRKTAASRKAAADQAKACAKLADGKLDAKAGKKALPSHPSRIWVQIGVGRDTSAIAFDWRKFVKQAPALFKGRTAYISDMGRTNRILAGPFESQKAASTFLAAAKKADFGSAFIWTSPAGQVVDPISAK